MSSISPSQNIGPVGLSPILIGDEKLLKPASKLMSFYRLRIEEIKGGQSSNQLHPMVRIRTSERAGK